MFAFIFCTVLGSLRQQSLHVTIQFLCSGIVVYIYILSLTITDYYLCIYSCTAEKWVVFAQRRMLPSFLLSQTIGKKMKQTEKTCNMKLFHQIIWCRREIAKNRLSELRSIYLRHTLFEVRQSILLPAILLFYPT